jgi:hypothetical protein
VPLSLLLTVTLDGDELALTMLDGTEHSRLPVDDGMDAAEGLEMLEVGTPAVRLLWNHEELDACLERYGYVRTTPWGYGPTAKVTHL